MVINVGQIGCLDRFLYFLVSDFNCREIVLLYFMQQLEMINDVVEVSIVKSYFEKCQ